MNKQATIQQIRSDIERFRPGRNTGDVDVHNDTITKEFRYLGNWIDDEEDRSDDDFDESDWEDNDQQIWASGEYKKYIKIFTEWAQGYPWFKDVKLGLTTSEKNWCEFSITVL